MSVISLLIFDFWSALTFGQPTLKLIIFLKFKYVDYCIKDICRVGKIGLSATIETSGLTLARVYALKFSTRIESLSDPRNKIDLVSKCSGCGRIISSML